MKINFNNLCNFRITYIKYINTNINNINYYLFNVQF